MQTNVNFRNQINNENQNKDLCKLIIKINLWEWNANNNRVEYLRA